MEFVWLVPTMSKAASGLSELKDFDLELFETGEPILDIGEGFFELDRDLNKRYGPSKFGGDLLANEDDFWVVSARLKEFFEAEKISEVHFVPVPIFEGRKRHDGYFVMQFLADIECIDENETTITYGVNGMTYVDNLTFDAGAIGDEKLFKAADLPQPVFARADFAEKMQAQKFESFLVKPVVEFLG